MQKVRETKVSASCILQCTTLLVDHYAKIHDFDFSRRPIPPPPNRIEVRNSIQPILVFSLNLLSTHHTNMT